MSEIDDRLAANAAWAGNRTPGPVGAAPPTHRLVVLTCMDARIDVFAVLGLELGQAHVLRNAGGRVTDDVLRSLAVSSHVLGTDRAMIVQHTGCGMLGAPDAALREQTGADLDFLGIADHEADLRADIDRLAAQPYLDRIVEIAGCLYDLSTGQLTELHRWSRQA